MQPETDKKIVASSSRPKNKRVLRIALIVLAILAVFIAGVKYGEKRKMDDLTNRIAAQPAVNITKGLEIKLFGTSVTLSGEQSADSQALSKFFAGISADTYKKASFADLIQAYGYANSYDLKTEAEQIKSVLQSRRAEFTKEEQESLKNSGI
ncbi:hypothetical protein KA047_01120 [Candidatus Saccharibacteria bacterium]|nr:hypothetical protein [Candidatus Saccharibacteria bacterium]